jgi:aminopeptidase YwaD
MTKHTQFPLSVVIFECLILVITATAQVSAPVIKPRAGNTPRVCARCIRAHMEFLASDAMNGRGSATHDELVAAAYVASELRAYGIEPAGDNGGYMQQAVIFQQKLTGAPQVVASEAGKQPVTLQYGQQFLSVYLTQTQFAGPLQKADAENAVQQARPGSVILIAGDPGKARQAAFAAVSAGAAGALITARDATVERFTKAAKGAPPKLPMRLESGAGLAGNYNVLELTSDAFLQLNSMPEGTEIRFNAPSEDVQAHTWNAVGILRGSDPALSKSAILLSAHLDHLGIGKPVNGDEIYNGADDDASGTAAVLELARVLGSGPRPKRSVIFALFGSEEVGGLGSTYFREHPPVPLTDIAATLEFEMLGRADPKVNADTVWLTGWERSNLGPTLATHGAKLVADPHPDQNFFARSDNFVLAKKGVVAQTVSSYGLHEDYHQPSDDLAHIDFKHMDAAIGSMLGPVQWLVNSKFTPKWNAGGKP